MYWNTRADDLAVKATIGLMERNAAVPADRIDDVAIAATSQTGDQGLTLGRSVAILAGLPQTVPGLAVERMCAGAMTSVTTMGASIGVGMYDLALAGGVEHMGHHPIGANADPNPRFVAEKMVDPGALNMGVTAERIFDRFPHLTKERSDRYGMRSQQKVQAAYDAGKIQPDLVSVAIKGADGAWGLATEDEGRRPQTTMEDLAGLKTPFRPHGRVTAGTSSPLTDGATMSLLAGGGAVKELGLAPKMRMVSFAFAGVQPEIMGIGPIPSTEKALKKAGLDISDIGLFELNEAFAIQVISCSTTSASTTTTPREPVGRRDRRGPPAGRIRRPPHDPARGAVRRAPRRALRPDGDVRRSRSGRIGHLGEPALRRKEEEVSYDDVDFSPIQALTEERSSRTPRA